LDDVPPEPQSGSTYFNNLLDSLLSIKRNHAFVPGYFKISNFAYLKMMALVWLEKMGKLK
jgi:hypothetical protein